MAHFTRRQFLKGALATGAALSLPTQRVLGANDDIRLGFIALGGQGRGLLGSFSGIDGVRVVGLAEPDRDRLDAAHEDFPDADAYTDFREMLERDDIDAIVMANCVHWHGLATCMAIEAGKDVYVEKPHCYSIWESQQIVARANHYGKLVQVGTQHRSASVQQEVKDWLASGAIGDVQWVRSTTYNSRNSIGIRDTPMTPPEHVDYDLWLGPAQDLPIYRQNFQYDWHWVWNTGGGEAANWGPHILDDVYNIVFDDAPVHPRSCMSVGGRVAWNDGGETPNIHMSYFETDSVPVSYEVVHLPVEPGGDMGGVRGTRNGYVIQCEGGYYSGGRGGGDAYDNDGAEIQSFRGGSGAGEHHRNFISAVRNQDRSELNADVSKLHYSICWCHWANVAYRLGQSYDPEHVASITQQHDYWEEAWEDITARLRAHDIDPEGEGVLQAGPVIEIDSDNETLAGDSATPEALALLRREYREPYVLQPFQA